MSHVGEFKYQIVERIDGTFGLYRVYFDEDGEPLTRGVEPVTFTGGSRTDILQDLMDATDEARRATSIYDAAFARGARGDGR